jgi:glycosyltransferase involved in cell wall biosynthesis
MKITYLVANYNNGRYIQDCIDSLNMQTNPNWLCIIVDDKSTDNSLEIIKPLLNDKIKLIDHHVNQGKIRMLRLLIGHVKTEIAGILDPDDALYPEATDYILKAYNEFPSVGFVYSNWAYFNEDLTMMVGEGFSAAFRKTSITGGFVGAIRTFKVSCYNKTSGWDLNMSYAEDRDFVYKMEEVTKFYFINNILYKYRLLHNSQYNSPQKNAIGYSNHLLACKNAIKRRNIQGVELLQYKLYMLANIPHDKNFLRKLPHPIQLIIKNILKICAKILGW